VAAAQVLVYAGAVMVMFLFVIAYLGGRADAPFAGGRSLARVAAVAAGGAILVEIVVVIALEAGGEFSTPAEITDAFGSPGEIGRLFLSDYLLAFEVTSFVLLVGALGGVVLGSHARRRDADADETAEAAGLPPGEAA
jgi:NADH:ubiquinone oxidoreductase subunit 6 (subunit J)